MITCTYKPLPRPSYRPCTNGVRHSLDSATAAWECSWSNDHGANLTEDLCDGCASELRRREVDRELREIGARMIRLQDLGAALEANEQGRHAAFVAGLAMEGRAGLLYLPKTRPIVAVFPSYVYEVAREAAHLARLALGEG